MGKIIYITGGARSGKSTFAENLLVDKNDVLYVATGIACDEEMEERIAKHRSERNSLWDTVEAYKDLDEILKDKIKGKEFILLDCVTIMVTNLMILDRDIDWDRVDPKSVDSIEINTFNEVEKFIRFAKNFEGETIIVSNELGMGLVPPTPLGRYYRDIAGKVNQKIAREADEAFLMVSGISIKIK